MVMGKLSPMMQQYKKIKQKHQDCIVFFRLGDFYEMFFEDAITASKELEIALTGRDCGLEKRAPMCGVPFHAAENYISKLISKGYKVAICEQTSEAGPKIKLVDRDVVRIITPGTQISDARIDEKENNYICCLFFEKARFGYAYADVATGDFFVGEKQFDASLFSLLDELHRINPNEIIINGAGEKYRDEIQGFFKTKSPLISTYPDWAFEKEFAVQGIKNHFKISSLMSVGCQGLFSAISCANALIEYLAETQKITLSHINKISVSKNNAFMFLDVSTRRNLELISTMREGSEKGSLLWVLDKTKTSMGARALKLWISQPLQSKKDIEFRLNGVESLVNNNAQRKNIREKLTKVYDLERLATRIAYQTIDAKNCISLKNSIESLPEIKQILKKIDCSTINQINTMLDDLSDLFVLINSAVKKDPANGLKEGNIIADGYSEEVDSYRDIIKNGDEWMDELLENEKAATGIKNLKIGYNKIFGYYIEVTKSFLDKVPYRYKRKQTLAGCERYITEELKKLEVEKLSATEKCDKLEYQLFLQLRQEIEGYIERIQRCAKNIAHIDVLQSLATVALSNNYKRPTFNQSGTIKITDGRHPVVENVIKEMFTPNDTNLNMDDQRTIILTGPNMAGKSTYMRQVGIIILMAHLGGFVPAASCNTCIVDRIFTRVGAMDDLYSGQSTFMVEMNEVSNILRNATPNSLLILDEIGRGTSTLDGLSIAWSVIEYINKQSEIGAKTLFATHYHELTDLEERLQGVKNFRVTVEENADGIVFLHKIEKGGADKSFGIEVAKLAGLPDKVVRRSKNILDSLLQSHVLGQDTTKIHDSVEKSTVEETKNNVIYDYIDSIDIDDVSPRQALDILAEIKEKVKI
jgi:DNA mismatch repair protein MutS